LRKLLRRLKCLIIIALMFGTCFGLTLLFNCLPLAPPWFFSASLLMVAVLADYKTTVTALKLGGEEANPLVRYLFNKLGVKKGGMVVISFFIAFIIFPYRTVLPCQQLAMSCTYFWVPINNLLVLRGRRKLNK